MGLLDPKLTYCVPLSLNVIGTIEIFIKQINSRPMKHKTELTTSYISIAHISKPISQQFSSVAQSWSTLCDPMDCSVPGFPVHHQLLEHAQTHVH